MHGLGLRLEVGLGLVYAQYLKTKIHATLDQTFEPFKMVVILNYLTLIWRDSFLMRLTSNVDK